MHKTDERILHWNLSRPEEHDGCTSGTGIANS